MPVNPFASARGLCLGLGVFADTPDQGRVLRQIAQYFSVGVTASTTTCNSVVDNKVYNIVYLERKL